MHIFFGFAQAVQHCTDGINNAACQQIQKAWQGNGLQRDFRG